MVYRLDKQVDIKSMKIKMIDTGGLQCNSMSKIQKYGNICVPTIFLHIFVVHACAVKFIRPQGVFVILNLPCFSPFVLNNCFELNLK